jgi:2-polyprenyl-6-methoxyphenol hydroxylase-like FAD-dependent oxidoreductase
VLYDNLKDPSKILVNKDLADICNDATGVTAICADGSSFRGDILIGADGVFSKTRTKMWELAADDDLDLIEADKNCQCLAVPLILW